MLLAAGALSCGMLLLDRVHSHPGFGSRCSRFTSGSSLVQALLAAGASLQGTTQLDEMAFSLDGENAHYGAPENPAAPGRLAGGSSTGSAVSILSNHTPSHT